MSIPDWHSMTKSQRLTERALTELQLGIVAGEPMTFMGRPMVVTVSWPEGAPMGDEETVRAWARQELDKMRQL